ncbi:MAG: hypothetical protein LDL33_08650 [Desulfomonile sp.]|nr:hypothetical protein [Desulfomonile sp.]
MIRTILLALTLGISTSAWGSEGELLGTISESGRFQPKVRILKEGSSVIVTKVDPADKFEMLRIRFIFPGASRPDAMKDLFIQWEKQPEQWGKLWHIDTHRGFQRDEKLFTASWNTALSFVILDRSRDRRLHAVPWDHMIRMWLDGQPLTRAPIQELPVAAPARMDHFDNDGNAVTRTHGTPVTTNVSPQPPPAHSIDRTAQQALEQKYQDLTGRMSRLEHSVSTTVDKGLEKKYYDIRDRVSRLEHSVSMAQKWFFWGPLLSLVLSIVFSSVALFWAFARLTRSAGPGVSSAPYDARMRVHPDHRFRRTE